MLKVCRGDMYNYTKQTDRQQDNSRFNDTQHKSTIYNDSQQNNTQHNITLTVEIISNMLCVVMLSVIYAGYHNYNDAGCRKNALVLKALAPFRYPDYLFD
jgi:uncharacterized ion transporter superfamily protein YfcC